MIGEAGFKRVSGGLQYVDQHLEEKMRRESDPISIIAEKTDLLHNAGVDKVNLDLMYGIPGQTEGALINTLEAVMKILPDQITVYETRFNRTSLEHRGINREVQ